jgi:hypothetical protein
MLARDQEVTGKGKNEEPHLILSRHEQTRILVITLSVQQSDFLGGNHGLKVAEMTARWEEIKHHH